MKADRRMLAATIRSLGTEIRLVLLHGSDGAASSEVAQEIGRQFVDPADPLTITTVSAGSLASNPGGLADAAATVSMFGGRTLVRVDGVGDEAEPAARLLLEGRAGHPVVMVAGTLRKGSKLLALAETSASALAYGSYPPTPQQAAASVAELAARFSLRIEPAATAELLEASGGELLLLRGELEKLSVFLDATPERPQTVDAEAVRAIGAASGEAETAALVNAVAGGQLDAVHTSLAKLDASGTSGIALLRPAIRRFQLLVELRSAGDANGTSARSDANARPPFYPSADRDAIALQVARWTATAASGALTRLVACERAIKASGSAGDILASQLLLGLAMQAQHRR